MKAQHSSITDTDETLGYDKNNSKSQLHDESSSSSTLSAVSLSAELGNDSFEHVPIETPTNKVTPTVEDATSSKLPIGRIFVSKNIFKSVPTEVHGCPLLAPVHMDGSIATSVDNIETRNNCTEKQYRMLLPKGVPVLYTTRHSSNACSQPLILCKIGDKSNLRPVPGTVVKENNKITLPCPEQKVENYHWLQNDHDYPKRIDFPNGVKVIQRSFNFPKKQIIRGHRVYVPDRESKKVDNVDRSSGKKIEYRLNVNGIMAVTDEQDPLYIPNQQEKTVLPCTMLKKIKNPFVTPSQVNDKRKNDKKFSICCTVLPDSKGTSSSIPLDKQTLVESKKTKVASTKSMNSEHSIVKNYAVQNKIPRREKKHTNVDNSKFAVEKSNDSNSVYLNKVLLECTPAINSDYCRNFFIKNSAWDYLEPEFKGFNEREEIISKSCFGFFTNMMDNLRRKECQPETYTVNDLFYTRKIEMLDKEGRLKKVLIMPSQDEVARKRKILPPPFIYPPTKKCKIVLEKNEIVENQVKLYMLGKKLNSYILHALAFSKSDALKPLIILNKHNCNVLKVNEILCKHSNIIYVKNAEDKFPERLLRNKFVVSQIQQRTIKLISPNALRNFFM
ncbi:uncharacterized protein LOC123312022 isoform X2 [Coccinella septempunctata]|nr:uncharacterized protein LOC123312022 isoform X2 [Coccinella septempunctata]